MWSKLKPRVKQKLVGLWITISSVVIAIFLKEYTATLCIMLPLGLYTLFTKETYDF